MKAPHFLARVACFFLLAAGASAQSSTGGIPPKIPIVHSGGLVVTLATPGYEFDLVENADGTLVAVVVDPPTPTALNNSVRKAASALHKTANAASTTPPPQPSFPATFSVVNASRLAVPMTLANAGPASGQIAFKLYDSTGALIWQSIPLLTPTASIGATAAGTPSPTIFPLPGRQALRRTVQVPLEIDGKLLADGQYRLDAAVDGTPVFAASTSLLVKNVKSTPPPTGTGIKGTAVVGPISPVSTAGTSNEQPLPGAQIHVVEKRQIGVFYINPPFTADAVADDQGKFSVDTPAGTFLVTGHPPDPTAVLPRGTTQTVEVTSGAYTEITVHFDSGIR